MRVSSLGLAATLGFFLAQTSALASDFSYPPPSPTKSPLRLYATRYYVHYVHPSTAADSAPILKRDGSPTGIKVSKKDFCFGALQGTIAVQNGSDTAIYNVDGLAPQRSATCSYGSLKPAVNDALGLQAWAQTTGNGTFGLGTHGLRLVPFRTVAVDKGVIPIGTVLFIPALRGYAFDDAGTRRTHDGYVIAGDVGGGINGSHIDLFTGNYTGTPPTFVKSKPSGLFDAQVITDAKIVAELSTEEKYRP